MNYWDKLCTRFEKLNIHLKILVCMFTGALAAVAVVGLAGLLVVISTILGGVITAAIAGFVLLYLALYCTLNS